MADSMKSADSGAKTDKPVISARLGRLLGVVFLLFSLLVVNSVYLSAITLLEQTSNEIYQDYFYLLMFFAHLVLAEKGFAPQFSANHLLDHCVNRRFVFEQSTAIGAIAQHADPVGYAQNLFDLVRHVNHRHPATLQIFDHIEQALRLRLR